MTRKCFHLLKLFSKPKIIHIFVENLNLSELPILSHCLKIVRRTIKETISDEEDYAEICLVVENSVEEESSSNEEVSKYSGIHYTIVGIKWVLMVRACIPKNQNKKK